MPKSIQQEWTIGRAIDCDIVIDQSSISGRHAVVRRDDQGQVTLHDLNSRNGIFVEAGADGREKVTSTNLASGGVVYFGTHRVEIDDLLNQLPPLPVQATELQATPEPASRSMETPPQRLFASGGMAGWCFGAAASLLVVLAVLWMRPSGLVPSSNVLSPATNAETEDAHAFVEPAKNPVPDESSVRSTAVVGSPSAANRAEPRIFWLAVKHTATGNMFRLGSGIAIGVNRIAVPGSLLSTLTSLLNEGFDSPIVIDLIDGQTYPIADQRITESYLAQTAAVEEQTTAHEAVIEKIESGSLSKIEARTEFQNSVALLDRVIESQKAVDLGWLIIQDLSAEVPDLVDVELRPSQRLQVTQSHLQLDDPFWEAGRVTTPIPAARETSTIFETRYVGTQRGGISGPLVLTADAANLDFNWIGAPVLRDGNLVGMIVEQPSDPPDPGDVDTPSGEAVWFAITLSAMNRLLKSEP